MLKYNLLVNADGKNGRLHRCTLGTAKHNQVGEFHHVLLELEDPIMPYEVIDSREIGDITSFWFGGQPITKLLASPRYHQSMLLPRPTPLPIFLNLFLPYAYSSWDGGMYYLFDTGLLFPEPNTPLLVQPRPVANPGEVTVGRIYGGAAAALGYAWSELTEIMKHADPVKSFQLPANNLANQVAIGKVLDLSRLWGPCYVIQDDGGLGGIQWLINPGIPFSSLEQVITQIDNFPLNPSFREKHNVS